MRKVVCVFNGKKAKAWLFLLSSLLLRKLVLEVPGTIVWEENVFIRKRGR